MGGQPFGSPKNLVAGRLYTTPGTLVYVRNLSQVTDKAKKEPLEGDFLHPRAICFEKSREKI